jgi:hypothetical protein
MIIRRHGFNETVGIIQEQVSSLPFLTNNHINNEPSAPRNGTWKFDKETGKYQIRPAEEEPEEPTPDHEF